MSGDGGPWRHEPEPPEPRIPGHRWLIWAAVMALIGGGLWFLFRAFPGQVSTADDWGWLLRIVIILAFVSAAILTARRIDWSQKARHAAIWIGIVAVMAVGVAYQDELKGVGRRVSGEFAPASPVRSGPRELVVTADDAGGFYLWGSVNGERVRFLVDTGASDTVLSPSDAERVGVNMAGLRFDHMAETANGTGYGAHYVASSVAVGSIAFSDLPVVVNQAPMSSSLLGMSFLRRLESFQVRGRKLYLTAR